MYFEGVTDTQGTELTWLRQCTASSWCFWHRLSLQSAHILGELCYQYLSRLQWCDLCQHQRRWFLDRSTLKARVFGAFACCHNNIENAIRTVARRHGPVPRCSDLSGRGKTREAGEIFAKEGIVFSYLIRILQQGSVDCVPFYFWGDILRLCTRELVGFPGCILRLCTRQLVGFRGNTLRVCTRQLVVFVSTRREEYPGFFQIAACTV